MGEHVGLEQHPFTAQAITFEAPRIGEEQWRMRSIWSLRDPFDFERAALLRPQQQQQQQQEGETCLSLNHRPSLKYVKLIFAKTPRQLNLCLAVNVYRDMVAIQVFK